MNDPTGFKRFRLVDDLDAMTDEEFEALNEEQVILYLARAGISPMDTQRSLDRCFEMIEDLERQEAAKCSPT